MDELIWWVVIMAAFIFSAWLVVKGVDGTRQEYGQEYSDGPL